MAKVADRYLEVDPWTVTERGLHRDKGRLSEALFSLSNEYMGVRGYFEEGYSGPERMVGSYFNGVYDWTPIAHPHTFKGMVDRLGFLVNAVDWLYTRIRVGREPLDLARSKARSFVRRLDLRDGTLERSFVWHTRSGKRIRVTFLRFVSMATHQLGAQQIRLESLDGAATAKVQLALDFSTTHYALGHNLWDVEKTRRADGAVAMLGRVDGSGHRVFSCLRWEADAKAVKPVDADKRAGLELTVPLPAGQPVPLRRLVVHHVDKRPKAEPEKVWDRGWKLAERIARQPFDRHYRRHVDYWENVWRTQDIEIDGDEENQQGIRYCIFHLHQAYHGVDPSLNVSAKGLTGEEYWGCTWWDTETYCLPFYLFSNPPAAKNLIRFRHRTLRGALERAKQLDCRGARYPMCTHDGPEICPVWQHGDLEIHVSAAVAYGIRHYCHITGDRELLHGEGAEMLVQICRYYASRGAWSPRTGEFGWYGVMGADEFHMMVHNNAYTNVMALKSFVWTLETLDEMRRTDAGRYADLCRRTGLDEDEIARWREILPKVRTNRDPRTGLYEQHDGYFDLPHVDVDAIGPDQFPLYDNWAYPRIFRCDMIKQPDVLLLMFLLSGDYDRKTKRRNYDCYEPRCVHESSLSPGIHSILAAELGREEEAVGYSLHSSRLDLDNYNRNSWKGVHTTSMAAAWMNFVYGFGGLRSDGELLTIDPHLPAGWKRLRYRLVYRATRLEVTVEPARLSIRTIGGPPVDLIARGERVTVDTEGVSKT